MTYLLFREEKEKIRPLYRQLQAILSETPRPKSDYDVSLNFDSLEHFHSILKQLSNVKTIKMKEINPYDNFLVNISRMRGSKFINPITNITSESYYSLTEFRQKLHCLIVMLHTKYFENEPEPFSGASQISVSQTQNQKQIQNQKQKQTQSIPITLKISLAVSIIFNISFAIYFIYKFIIK